MKLKLLDYTLIGILMGSYSMPAFSQQATEKKGTKDVDPPGANVQCTDSVCQSEQGVVLKINTRGELDPVTKSNVNKISALAPDRRVTVLTEGPENAVVISKWSVQLPSGGVIWATEDPNLGQPQFNVTAPSVVAYDGEKITKPVRFYAYNNYPAFIKRAEIVIFRAIDVDLVAPLATVPLAIGSVSEVEWDGALPEGLEARTGDEFVYVARLYDEAGAFDETFPRRLQLVKPEEEERGQILVRERLEKKLGTAVQAEEAQRRSLVNDVFGENTLRLQNIPIYGSRIRIQGRNLPENATVTIKGQNQPVDLERKLVAEYLVPVGHHDFNIEISGTKAAPIAHKLSVDVTGKYFFAVALADVTVSGNSVAGSIEPLSGNENFDDSFILEGRLAFYAKGKIKGKYLITAQADTQEQEISELFNGFWDAKPQDIFRRLDPDAYYPVYGDDSVTYRDVDTQGRLYLRIDWDKNQAVWGNFATGFNSTEYGQYSRSLYGGAIDWRSSRTTEIGDAGSQLRAFASETQTSPGHSEFLGTGGSLYYLKHTDVLPGSEKVVLEIRDGTTGRVLNSVILARGADYEIDEQQGRIILSRPLATVTRENLPTISRDTPLDGYTQLLLADYEYVPSSGLSNDDVVAGFRGKHWFGNHVAVGGTYVDENRNGDDYSLKGLDVTLQKGRGTYLKIEHSESEASSAPVFFSDNGGLTFEQVNSSIGPRSGAATAFETRANFKELGWTKLDWSSGAWWRSVDEGFSISRFDTSASIEEYGVEVLGQFAPNVNIYGRYSYAERNAESFEQAQITGEWRITDFSTISAELRRVDERRVSGNGSGALAAAEYKHRFGTSLDLYGIGQVTLDDDSGNYEENNALTLGAKYLFGNLSTVGAEVVTGDRGDSAKIGVEYRVNQEHSLYGAYSYSSELIKLDPLFNQSLSTGWTLGQRWRISNQVNVFNESQFLKAPNESGLAHTFGMDFYPSIGWNLGFTLQKAELDKALGVVDRQAISLNGGYTNNDTQWQSKLEWREDAGAEQRTQWVTTNRLMYKFNDDFRIAARVNYSETEDKLVSIEGAKFIEANLGFAWRPIDTLRWALLGKYTYLYDVSAFGQNGTNTAFYDQRSQILSFEGVYKPDAQWEFAGKAMQRIGEVRYGRLTGQWADSGATFLAAQARYEFAKAWHSLIEYRVLSVVDGGTRNGALVGLDFDVTKNFRIGGGYNFTDFSDDLTDFDYDHKGWFINFVGSY